MGNLKALRETAGLTQQELADKAGIHFTTINRIENNHHRPHKSILKLLAAALNVKPEQIE